MKKVALKKIFSFTILIVLIAFFINYLYNHLHDFKQLEFVNPWLILILMIITLIFSINNGLITKFLLQPFKIRLKFKEWFGLSVTTTFYNLITPFKGGAISRALYLNVKHNFSYSHFVSTLSGSYVVIVLTAVLTGIVATLGIYLFYGIFSWLIFLFLIALLIPLLIIITFSPKIPETKNEWINKFIHVINGWHSIKSNKKSIFFVVLLTSINLIIGTIGTMISYRIIDINLGFLQALFITSVGSLSILIAITPGGLGIVEAIAVFLASILGITPAESLTASIIIRVAGMIVIFTLGPIYSYILLNHLNNKDKREKK